MKWNEPEVRTNYSIFLLFLGARFLGLINVGPQRNNDKKMKNFWKDILLEIKPNIFSTNNGLISTVIH